MRKLVLASLLLLAACGVAQKHAAPGTAYGISTSPGGAQQGPGH